MRRFVSVSAIILCAVMTGRAQVIDRLPKYQPKQTVTGTLRLWGHGSPDTDFMGKLVRSWEDGFRRYHPDIKFDNRMYGTASAMGALYTGVGDLAILGREIWPNEISSFEKVFHYDPVGIDITTGSLDIRNMDFALNVFVHKDNPISKLSLTQVDAIFGSEHRRGSKNIRTWGELGLTGEWKDKPIDVYGRPLKYHQQLHIERLIFHGGDKWNETLREFADVRQPDGKLLDGGQRILDALKNDRYGIAYSNLRYMNPQVKPLALRDGGPYYEA